MPSRHAQEQLIYNLFVPVNEIPRNEGGSQRLNWDVVLLVTCFRYFLYRITSDNAASDVRFHRGVVCLSQTAIIDVGFACRVRTRLCPKKDKQLLQGHLYFLHCLHCLWMYEQFVLLLDCGMGLLVDTLRSSRRTVWYVPLAVMKVGNTMTEM